MVSAAYCCAHLLSHAGFPVAIHRPSRPRLRAIVLSDAAINLIAEVFARRSLFSELPRIRSRDVIWGSGAERHFASLGGSRFRTDIARQHPTDASRPLPPSCEELGFGSRIARASTVDVRKSDGPGCWVESLNHGWLFLMGNGEVKCWPLSVGSAVGALIGQSRLIAGRIERIGAEAGEFPAFPA